jgi:hypothetical protein
MAWDEFKFAGGVGVSGDRPIDEMALALAKVVAAYESRFSRKPTTLECVYAFRTVLQSDASRYVADPTTAAALEFRIPVAPKPSIDFADFEGAYVDEPKPGYFQVLRKAKAGVPETEVIRVSPIAVENRSAKCRYKILASGIGESDAVRLIKTILFEQFCGGHYDSRADRIECEPAGDATTVP